MKCLYVMQSLCGNIYVLEKYNKIFKGRIGEKVMDTSAEVPLPLTPPALKALSPIYFVEATSQYPLISMKITFMSFVVLPFFMISL